MKIAYIAMVAALGLSAPQRGAAEVTSCDETVSVAYGTEGEPFSVHLACWSDSQSPSEGLNILLVHGFVHNAHIFEPAADWILTNYPNQVARVYAIDLPGHGGSDAPSEKPLGQLTLENYVSSLHQVLSSLNGRIDVLIGHSMGGLLIQMFQQELLDQGKSLAGSWETGAGFGVNGVMLMAPSLPEEVSWAYAEGQLTEEGPISPLFITLAPCIRAIPGMGMICKTSPDLFLDMFFTAAGSEEPLPDAPSDGELSRLSDLEPLAAALEVGGLAPQQDLKRPSIDPAIFSETLQPAFAMISYGNDVFWTIEEQTTLFQYVRWGEDRGLAPSAELSVVESSEARAVHDCAYLEPNLCFGPAFDSIIQNISVE